MRKAVSILTAAVLAAVFFLVLTLPPSVARAVWKGDAHVAETTVGGAFHVHSTLSDGRDDRAAIARAAASAGLRFVVFTDHGDGTRPPAPPEYVNGVLAIDGVEISTDGGHYAVAGMARAPYPLGGEPDAVAEDVRRLGGLGFAAHPDSQKSELPWTDWRAPIDGVEWLNVDSEWRDETRPAIARALISYWLRPGPAVASLFDRPVATLDRWDRLVEERPLIAIAAHDAHGGVPSYGAVFRSLALRVVLPSPLVGNPVTDADLVLRSLRAGRVFAVVSGRASPGILDFVARDRFGRTHRMGDVAPPGPVRITAQASMPPGAELTVLRSGGEVARSTADRFERTFDEEGTYRIEVRVPGAPGTPPTPWLVSNPIYVRPPVPPAPVEPSVVGPALPAAAPWHIEKSEATQAALSPIDGAVQFRFRLSQGRTSQFAALAVDLTDPIPFRRIGFEARASRPMRVSVQLRYPGRGQGRWGKSLFIDGTRRDVAVLVDRLVPADHQRTGAPSPMEAATLLFVVDLTNALPGDDGLFEIGRVRFGR